MAHSASILANPDLSTLAERLGRYCRERGVTLTVAESCTGGGVASAITSVSGSSDYFEIGYVTYSNAAKTRLLGVPENTLAEQGAVSGDVVRAMVAGACRDSGAQLGVAVSGVAGPGGGTVDKPVGTVWLAWGNAEHQQAECFHFPGGRQEVREQAVRESLAGLVARLTTQAKNSENK
ncbi:CinA family protein [Vreelandella olivaria]|uniref:CinA family protein n=1 Tax=Vreelandella olivaria TaxID=390919 RepID=UPI00201EF6DF|nr:CinA family protein [Halomonas olivaria]